MFRLPCAKMQSVVLVLMTHALLLGLSVGQGIPVDEHVCFTNDYNLIILCPKSPEWYCIVDTKTGKPGCAGTGMCDATAKDVCGNMDFCCCPVKQGPCNTQNWFETEVCAEKNDIPGCPLPTVCFEESYSNKVTCPVFKYSNGSRAPAMCTLDKSTGKPGGCSGEGPLGGVCAEEGTHYCCVATQTDPCNTQNWFKGMKRDEKGMHRRWDEKEKEKSSKSQHGEIASGQLAHFSIVGLVLVLIVVLVCILLTKICGLNCI